MSIVYMASTSYCFSIPTDIKNKYSEYYLLDLDDEQSKIVLKNKALIIECYNNFGIFLYDPYQHAFAM